VTYRYRRLSTGQTRLKWDGGNVSIVFACVSEFYMQLAPIYFLLQLNHADLTQSGAIKIFMERMTVTLRESAQKSCEMRSRIISRRARIGMMRKFAAE